MSRRVLSLLAPASLALALAGCVSVFPQAKPVQLYELSPDLGTGAPAPTAQPVDVRLVSVAFEEASAGDRLLTVKNGEAAYIGGARWVSPAQVLFGQGLERAFAAHDGSVRLVPHGDAASAPLSLSVSVEAFRVSYVDGAPTVETVLHARMVRFPERTMVLDRRIAVTRKVEANRVSAIVRAYDAALGAALTELVNATEQAAARA
jgi:cholesterol transport system auxiliary component